MVIVLKSKNKSTLPAPSSPQRFTIEDIENLFKQSKDWKKFYLENENKLWESNIDIYQWPVYPLCTKEDQFYRCLLHPQIEVKCGSDKKPLVFFFKNIHYAEFISHCISYKPEEHKQYIVEKLLGGSNNNNHVSSTE